MSTGRYREVRVGGREVRVAVRRNPRARRISLSIGSGEVRLTLPPGASEAAGLAFLRSRGDWVAGRLRDAPAPVPFEPGQTVPFRGRPHRIRLDPSLRDPLLLEDDRILLASPAGCSRLVEGWLRHEARLAFGEAVARHAAAQRRDGLAVDLDGAVHVRPPQLMYFTVRELGAMNTVKDVGFDQLGPVRLDDSEEFLA